MYIPVYMNAQVAEGVGSEHGIPSAGVTRDNEPTDVETEK